MKESEVIINYDFIKEWDLNAVCFYLAIDHFHKWRRILLFLCIRVN